MLNDDDDDDDDDDDEVKVKVDALDKTVIKERFDKLINCQQMVRDTKWFA